MKKIIKRALELHGWLWRQYRIDLVFLLFILLLIICIIVIYFSTSEWKEAAASCNSIITFNNSFHRW